MSDRLAGLRRYALVRLAKARAGVVLDEEPAEEMLKRGGRIARALRLAARDQSVVAAPAVPVNTTIRSFAPGVQRPLSFAQRLRGVAARVLGFLRAIIG